MNYFDDWTLTDYFDQVVAQELDDDRRARTAGAIQALSHWVGREVTMLELCDSMINEYADDLTTQRQVGPGTIATRRRLLRAIGRHYRPNDFPTKWEAGRQVAAGHEPTDPDADPSPAAPVVVALTEAVRIYCDQNPRITSKQTVRRYHTTIGVFSDWLGRAALSSDLTGGIYGKWIQTRRTQVAPGTVRGDAEKLLVIWKWLAIRGLAETPNVALPRASCSTPSTFTDAELRRLWAEAATTKRKLGSVPGSVFWPALLAVLYETAERVGAVHAATWDHIDLEAGTVYFPAASRKGGCADSLKFLTGDSVAKLRKLHEYAPAVPPFLPGVSHHTVRKAFEALLVDAGITPSRRKKFHGLRARAASDIVAGGGDAALHLGHSDPRITRKSYIDPTIAQKVKPTELLYGWQRESKLGVGGSIAAAFASAIAWFGK